MTGSELREVRRRLRLERLAMARLIGYTGTDRNDTMRIKRLENSSDPVPLYIARLVWLIEVWSRRYGTLPPFPDWPGYDYDHSPDPQHQEQVDADHG